MSQPMHQAKDESHYTLLIPVQDTLLKLTAAEADQNQEAYSHLVNQLTVLAQISFSQSDLIALKTVNHLERNLSTHVRTKLGEKRNNSTLVDVLQDNHIRSITQELLTLVAYKCSVLKQQICMNGLKKTVLASQTLTHGDPAQFNLNDLIDEMLLDLNNVFTSYANITPFNPPK